MSAPRNLARSVLDRVKLIPEAHAGKAWPSVKYQKDPLGFCRDILGVELWQFQKDFLLAIVDNRHVAVAGGRKIGKDFAVGCAALWWYASFPKARVILLAPTSKQLDEILYREILMLWDGAGRCVQCKIASPEGPKPCAHSALLSGRRGGLARTGIKSNDFRQILGITAVNEGGLRGLSGGRILAIEDEASDIKDEFDTALVGNLAAAEDCRRVLISNPVHGYGFFFRAFHEEKHLYKCLQVSTADNPNVTSGKRLFPGLADSTWLRDRELAWGRGTAPWLANVEGKFPRAEAGQLFTLDMIADSQKRWQLGLVGDGRLCIGVDVAGEGRDGDETAICVRRGMRVISIEAARGMTGPAILHRIRGLLAQHRTVDDGADNRPAVILDRDGAEGARVYTLFREHNWNHELEFQLIGFRGAEPPPRHGDTYRLTRDALYGGLLDWFRLGGTVPEDLKLEGELYAMRWVDHVSNKQVLVSKSDLAQVLSRSPDRCDSLALSTWGSGVSQIPESAAHPESNAVDPYKTVETHAPGAEFDIYSSDQLFDPYR